MDRTCKFLHKDHSVFISVSWNIIANVYIKKMGLDKKLHKSKMVITISGLTIIFVDTNRQIMGEQ